MMVIRRTPFVFNKKKTRETPEISRDSSPEISRDSSPEISRDSSPEISRENEKRAH
jgi:hypothetical protein